MYLIHVRIEFAQKGITLTQHVTPGSCPEMGTICIMHKIGSPFPYSYSGEATKLQTSNLILMHICEGRGNFSRAILDLGLGKRDILSGRITF